MTDRCIAFQYFFSFLPPPLSFLTYLFYLLFIVGVEGYSCAWLHSVAHTHTHSVGLLWTRDRPDAETSTCTTHEIHKGQTLKPPAGFEPAIPASERTQTYALDRADTGFGCFSTYDVRRPQRLWGQTCFRVDCHIDTRAGVILYHLQWVIGSLPEAIKSPGWGCMELYLHLYMCCVVLN